MVSRSSPLGLAASFALQSLPALDRALGVPVATIPHLQAAEAEGALALWAPHSGAALLDVTHKGVTPRAGPQSRTPVHS